MQHQFITTSHNLIGLFADVNSMSGLIKRIQKQAEIDPIRYDINKYKGDAFEFFVELFLSIYSTDNRVGVYKYSPIPPYEDKGVDGTGVNMLGDKCVVQVKFRSNSKHLLTSNKDQISNIVSAGALMGVNFDLDNPKNFRHFVFTTASNLHFYTDAHMFEGKVKCFGIEQFRSMVDNNQHFWDKCREIVGQLNPTN